MTVWYQKLLASFAAQPGFVPDLDEASLIIPTYDVAGEMNWPFFGRMDKAYLHGSREDYDRMAVPLIRKILRKVHKQVLLVIDMNPFSNLRKIFQWEKTIMFAAGSAGVGEMRQGWDFGFPASPLISADLISQNRKRRIFASFIGYNSHSVRKRLATLHNGNDVIVHVSDKRPHSKNISPQTSKNDEVVRDFVELIENSTYSFVPRGDALFSYRLLEVMRGGSIPVILSDGWALPFADLIDWNNCAVVWPESRAEEVVKVLRSKADSEVERLFAGVTETYSNYFATLELQAAATLAICAKNMTEGYPRRAALGRLRTGLRRLAKRIPCGLASRIRDN